MAMPQGRPPERSSPPRFTPGPNNKTVALEDGTQRHSNPATQVSVHTNARGEILGIEKPGLRANAFRSDGRAAHIEQVRADGSRVIVERGSHDARRIEVVRPGGVRVVTYGGYGFVERPYRSGYVARTYLIGGRPEVMVYRTGYYRNVPFRSYVPGVVYAPAYYGWAARPWAVPVPYAWAPRPWYGAYYVPERVYPSASFWLADFVLAESLRVAYEARAASGMAALEQTQATIAAPISPEVKQQIADQVRMQVEADQQASTRSSGAAPVPAEGLPAALDPNYKVFVVSTDVDVKSTDGRLCTLTAGDVIQRGGTTVSAEGNVGVVVMSSKSAECPAQMRAEVDLATLQDMHNQFRQQIAAGLDRLASSAGSDGIPPAPPANPQPMAEGQAPVDEQAPSLLATQSKDADQVDEEVALASKSAP